MSLGFLVIFYKKRNWLLGTYIVALLAGVILFFRALSFILVFTVLL